MQEKFLKVWEEIEDAIGICCLHKRAAFMEVAGKPIQQLTLVTTAPIDVILEFIGQRNVDDKQKKRFLFAHNGIQVDLTTHCDLEDMDELYCKSFRHSLTIDSIGVRRDGMISSSYNGIEDIRDKILRLTDENSIISEGLFRRILMLHVFEDYSLDPVLKGRIEKDKFFQKEGYRKKYCEIFIATVRSDHTNWSQVAKMLDMPGCPLGHKKAFVSYTQRVTDDMVDERFKRTFIFLIMALLKVTSKELQGLMAGVPTMEYYDSLCANLSTKIETQDALKRMKSKYGEEFVDILYDLQELLMKDVEGAPFRRYTERDFDKMGLVASDGNLWFDRTKNAGISKTPIASSLPKQVEPVTETEEEAIKMEGTAEFLKLMKSDYTEEDYPEEEATEGVLEDTYEISEETEQIPNPYAGEKDNLEELAADSTASMGFNPSDLDVYENVENPNQTSRVVQGNTVKNSVFNSLRGHKSSILNSGS